MKRILAYITVIFILMSAHVYADGISILYNNILLDTGETPPLIVNDRTVVPIRTVCQAMGLVVSWNSETKTTIVSNKDKRVEMHIGEPEISIDGVLHEIDCSPQIINDLTYIPIRSIVSVFGADVSWNNDKKQIIINYNLKQNPAKSAPKPERDKKVTYNDSISANGHTFYAQPDAEWEFENNGRGYCWVCCYAMVLSDLNKKRITPLDIAEYNLENGYNGNYISSHYGISSTYGAKLVQAISSSSPYFDYFDNEKRCATYLKFETEEDVKEALKEALSNHPEGVMVRFEGYPHTIVAIAYDENDVYFNDPASTKAENVTFEHTCLAANFKLTDISFIQALQKK